MESDDAADLIAELSEDKKEKVIKALADEEQAIDIIDLLNYAEDTAGALMAKELIKVNLKWTINECIVELRKQAEQVENIHTVYAIDDQDKLIGRITLKHLLVTPPDTLAESIVDRDIQMVLASANETEVIQKMEKYDLVVIPVVDELKRLLGRITIDDVVDVMKEEAEKDYQMASGISENVEYSDSVFQLTKARFPWLLIGLIGGIAGAKVIGVFGVIEETPILAYFMPLIAAMGGNVGVQSSAIVVQSIANNSLRGSVLGKLSKELGVGLLNGLLCSIILLLYNLLFADNLYLSFAVSTSLFCVIIIAAIFGTWIPLMLNHFKIDPALATGPFITTVNDVVGLLLYFSISSLFIS
jgi:magnesium transporter